MLTAGSTDINHITGAVRSCPYRTDVPGGGAVRPARRIYAIAPVRSLRVHGVVLRLYRRGAFLNKTPCEIIALGLSTAA